MKKILSLIIIATISFNVFSQSIQNNTYTVSGQKLVNGNTSMTVSGSAYSTTPLTAGGRTMSPGFLQVFNATNNPIANSTIDSLALVDLYNATAGTEWTNSTGWLSAPLAEWHGVTLDPSGRVQTVDLNNNNLSGAIPQSFKNLDSLKNIYFYVNPSLEANLFDFLANFSKLERVSAHDCAFTGTILPSVFTPSLLELRVFNNQFSGVIPGEIGNATALEQFDLSGNQLRGNIPASIGALKALTNFNINQNDSIKGTLPAEIGQMTNLRFLFIENCSLSGQIPAEILNCTNLEELWMISNNFQGTMPDVLNLPNFTSLQAGGNRNLLVDLPDNLGELTALKFLSIWNTLPNRGEFPAGVYNLTNLTGLDLSEQQFTGTIDPSIGNLTKLESLYLRNNNLTDAFPVEITAAALLNVLDLSSNNFNFVPDLSALGNLQTLNLSRNNLEFASLLPFADKSIEYIYAPQNPIGIAQTFEVAIGGEQTISSDITNDPNAKYQWALNGDSLSTAVNPDLTISNFTTAKSGRYVLYSTSPQLPDLNLRSAPITLKIQGGKSNWYLDNRPGTIADFRSLSQAVSATKAGDTIYVSGSVEPYTGAVLNEAKVIIGPGYFLDNNTETQFNKNSARLGNVYLQATADGSKVYGVEAAILGMNFQSSTLTDTLKNVTIEGNKIREFVISDKHDQIDVKRNFINIFEFSSTSLNSPRTYDNIEIVNNIIDSMVTNFDIISTEKSSLNNVLVNNNTIQVVTNGINDLVFNDNIIATAGGSNTYNNSTSFSSALFTNASNSFSIDNDFVPVDGSLAAGAFSGAGSYILSGLPPIPTIYNLEIGSRLSTTVSVKSNSGSNLARVRYLYRRNNQSSTPFSAQGFTPSTDIEIEFLPNRSSLEPNQVYDLVFRAVDENGIRSHRTYIPYETLAANLTGSVVDIDNIDITTGNIRLFAINPFANKYDTTAVQALGGTNTFNFENLILGDYIVLADPDEAAYPNLIPTYYGNTLDWQIADTLFLEGDALNIVIEVEKEPAPFTEPGSEISGILEEEFDETDSNFRKLPRRRVSGAGVSVRTLAGSSRTQKGSLRLLDNDYKLVAYVKTTDNGEFAFPNLPAGDYRIRIEYPGVETDEAADIDFNLSGQQGEVVSVEALVEDGKITVTETGRVTANAPDEKISFRFYPNPATSELNLELSNTSSINEVTIFDLRGIVHAKIQIQSGKTSIDIKDLPTGTYLIKVENSEGNYMISKMLKK